MQTVSASRPVRAPSLTLGGGSPAFMIGGRPGIGSRPSSLSGGSAHGDPIGTDGVFGTPRLPDSIASSGGTADLSTSKGRPSFLDDPGPLFQPQATPPTMGNHPLAIPSGNLKAPGGDVATVAASGSKDEGGTGGTARDRAFTMPSLVDDYFPPAPGRDHRPDPARRVLNLAGMNLTEIPRASVASHGMHAKELNVSDNLLTSALFIIQFSFLEVIDLSRNQLKFVKFPPRIPTLVSLDISNNLIEDLEVITFELRTVAPNLQTLRTEANPGHPERTSTDAVKKYRVGTIGRLAKLEELDCVTVMPEDRALSQRGSFYGRVARPHPSEYQKKTETQKLAPIARQRAPSGPMAFVNRRKGSGSSATSKESEGNRHIKNDDL